MKAPFYVIDRTRKIVFGQFFKQSSADEVASILRHHSINSSRYEVEVYDASHYTVSLVDGMLKRGEVRKGTEADIQAIDAEKFLPRRSHEAMSVGHVVMSQDGRQQMVVVKLETSGRKWMTWSMRGLVDGRIYTRKCLAGTDRSKFVRMATPNELHGARATVAQRDENRQARVERNVAQADKLEVRPGDVVIMRWSDVGERAEVVEDVNWRAGRVALRRRGMAALVREKRRFVSAANIVSVKEKGPGYYRASNPIYDKYGFGSAPTPAQVQDAQDIKLLNQLARALR